LKVQNFYCSCIIVFENLSIIVSLWVFQNLWSFSVIVTISIHSWVLFTLIACWLAISEEMSLKSTIFKLLNQTPWIFLSWKVVKSRINVCELEGLVPIKKVESEFWRKSPKAFSSKSLHHPAECSNILISKNLSFTGLVRPYEPYYRKVFRTCLVPLIELE
jgi:hypothetical protein